MVIHARKNCGEREENTMKMTIVHKVMEKSTTVENPSHIPRVGDNIDMGFEPACKVVKVLWTKFPNFNDVFVVVD